MIHLSPVFRLAALCLGLASTSAIAQQDPPLISIDRQPFQAQARRVAEALAYLGEPLLGDQQEKLQAAYAQADDPEAVRQLQRILDARVLFTVHINPEMRVKVAQGPAPAELVENGWRIFLVKVHNESGTTAALRAHSPNAGRLHNAPAPQISELWLDLAMFDRQPLKRTLSGLDLEYRIIQLYSRDTGKREAKFSFDVGQGSQDLGFRNETDVLFTCQPAIPITLQVKDEHGDPTTASFLIKDAQGRIYPAPSKRLAPDFSFHLQVYRMDNEILRLPQGSYTIEFSRGPESIPETRRLTVDADTKTLAFQVERWIDPAAMGWWSGDHHIHAAGCAHYTDPTEGVHASDMLRHCQGEDLKIGANLTWGPCFDYQKQFFTGDVDPVSSYPYLLRYDVEVSGFGSHQSGHLCLLRLKHQIYPGGDSKHHWPKLGLNTLRWAKKQGAVCGPAHSGWGLAVDTDELPNYQVPPYDGIGANEYIVDVTHLVPGPEGDPVPAVDFISTVDTPYVWELNIWYHTLNCGFRTRISGETDFPCIYGEKVGLGRSYVWQENRLNYDDWCEGIREGRNYVSDGKSHLIDFQINDLMVGKNGSEQHLQEPGRVRIAAKVGARLNETPNPVLRDRPYQQKPYWDIERARIGDSRQVAVEVIVNGLPVDKKIITADGRLDDVTFDVPIEKSSWVALRILPSSHTNPIFVIVGDQPIRASKKSAEWCLKSVDQCWSQKKRFIGEDEMQEAIAAYDHARQTYRRILQESN